MQSAPLQTRRGVAVLSESFPGFKSNTKELVDRSWSAVSPPGPSGKTAESREASMKGIRGTQIT